VVVGAGLVIEFVVLGIESGVQVVGIHLEGDRKLGVFFAKLVEKTHDVDQLFGFLVIVFDWLSLLFEILEIDDFSSAFVLVLLFVVKSSIKINFGVRLHSAD
jgi:hypothetical protein